MPCLLHALSKYHRYYPGLPRITGPLLISYVLAIEVVQHYQLNHSHDGAEHNEARAEDSLAT